MALHLAVQRVVSKEKFFIRQYQMGFVVQVKYMQKISYRIVIR